MLLQRKSCRTMDGWENDCENRWSTPESWAPWSEPPEPHVDGPVTLLPFRNSGSSSSTSAAAIVGQDPATPVRHNCAKVARQAVPVEAPVETPPKVGRAHRLRKKTPGPYAGIIITHGSEQHREAKAAAYLGHVCHRAWQSLCAQAKQKLADKWRQWKHRVVCRLKAGKVVTLSGIEHVCETPAHWSLKQRDFEIAVWEEMADNPKNTDCERGLGMSQFLKLTRFEFKHFALSADFVHKGRTCLVTYQGPWGIVAPESLAEPIQFEAPVDVLCAVLVRNAQIMVLCEQMDALCLKLMASRAIDQYAWSCELCCRTWKEKHQIRVHLHMWAGIPCHHITAKCMEFKNTLPQHSVNQLAMVGVYGSTRSGLAMYAGCFYVTVPKVGSLLQRTSKTPFVDFMVKDTWITSLYSASKITAQVAEDCFLKCVVRAEMNVKQLRFVEAGKLDAIQRAERASVEFLVTARQRRFRDIDLVHAWSQQYSQLQDRYKFLVLDGPSQQGKTRFAASLVPCNKLYYLDCSSCALPDLRGFRKSAHDLILFDELKAEAAIAIKKLLQASNDLCTLGSSPTNQHIYTVWAHATRMVIASNIWRTKLTMLQPADKDWLELNSFYVYVDSPLWVQDEGGV